MATQREKQLAITLLKERIEHATGKKVILKETTSIPELEHKFLKTEEFKLAQRQIVSILEELENKYDTFSQT